MTELNDSTSIHRDNDNNARLAFQNELQEGTHQRLQAYQVAQAKPFSLKPEACPVSREYNLFINTAARNMFNATASVDVQKLLNKHNCAIKTPADAIAKANSELEKHDYFTYVMTPKQVQELNEATTGRYAGIGIDYANAPETPAVAAVMAKDHPPTPPQKTKAGKPPVIHEYPTIDGVIENTPAQRSGLQQGDVITKINGKSVRDLPPDAVGELLSGRINTHVNLSLVRDGVEIKRRLTRAEIDAPTVSKPVDKGDGVFHIRISSFGREDTAVKLQEAIEKNPDAKGFVIDVRDNPGGLFDAAIETSSLFISKGLIMSTRERLNSDPQNPVYETKIYGKGEEEGNYIHTTYSDNRASTREFQKTMPNVVNGRPVVLMYDGDSASASEIVAGALHDSAENVTTLGTKSYGKGTAQTIFTRNMPAGTNLKVTTLRYYTPSGFWPGDADKNKIGLTPDITVPNPAGVKLGREGDLQLAEAVRIAKQKVAERALTMKP